MQCRLMAHVCNFHEFSRVFFLLFVGGGAAHNSAYSNARTCAFLLAHDAMITHLRFRFIIRNVSTCVVTHAEFFNLHII